ncbi:hypothetical protein PHK61_31580 [Actinomycetospora lutea]|uniref:pyridoxamine 5'-phosphate oxidase family protein n=1 Tax=Actinomycetospora lutea TaxID=663604 RepID=UPI0023666E36|nr:pyridoxamine 5'-phosphate oxidase family protein [Actinomycetospora lutea]MDD7942957.1 hypothetical protein [Actinomycetospora lutea]
MLSPTTWTELSPHDCEDLLRSCTTGRFVYTEWALPAVQPTGFHLDGARLLFPAPPRFKIAHGHVFSFHVQADDAAWTVMAHGPVNLRHARPPEPSRTVLDNPRPVQVDPDEPLALEIQLLVGRRLQQLAAPA